MHLARKFQFLTWILLSIACCSTHVRGQTLTEKLILENPAKLVEESKKTGDVVRGAILFHQGNINCANCHRATADAARIGPDLSRLSEDTTDASLVQSILQPSKTIADDYRSTKIFTVDGTLVTGLIASEDDQQIVLRTVLRTGQFGDERVTIAIRDIEERQLSDTSSMPSGLVDELKNRQQFLDLLRYVIDLKENEPVDAGTATNEPRRELTDHLKGLVLIDKLNCAACHQSSLPVSVIAADHAPNLKWSAKHLNPDYLADFIADPHQTKPGSTMPHLLTHLSQESRSESATAIVQYLLSLDVNQFDASPVATLDRDGVLRGQELFHSVGCVACHSPRTGQAIEQPLADSAPLGDLTAKFDTKSLTEFLKDPHAARPAGRMPNMVLSHREASDVSSFLLQPNQELNQESAGQGNRSWQPNTTLIKRGSQLFNQLNCSSCHSGIVDSGIVAANSAPSRFATNLKLDQLNPLNENSGCLSDKQGAWPTFKFSSEQQNQIRTAIRAAAQTLTPQQQVDVSLTALNCTACHSRDKLGGVAANRRSHFQTTNLNLGEQGRIPPSLTGVGAKLKSKWMRDVLVNQRSIRPYMKTRMPQYGEPNIQHLITLFQSHDTLPKVELADIEDPEKTRKLGIEIVGNQGLNCVACHTYQYKIADTMPAVDLTEMAERLKQNWFHQYMLAPQTFSPNTVMPSYWPGGKAIRSDIAGDPDSQVQAIWEYLLDGRQARAPQGVIREPLEIVVSDEARMLRRSYEGIGKRGIGVGYPGNVNLAFDAEQMRLATIWNGKFVDPSGVWYGQGHGKVRTLGRSIQFATGPDLDDQIKPWSVDEGRPPNHQFKGYVLDEKRRPTFRYAFDSIDVDDFFTEQTSNASDTAGLLRTIKMTATNDQDALRFRVASSPTIESLSDRTFQIGKRLTVSIVSNHAAKLVTQGETTSLQIPLDFEAGQTHELKIEYRISLGQVMNKLKRQH